MRLRAVARATALAVGVFAVTPVLLAAPARAAVTAPSAPRAVTAAPADASVVVRWQPPSSTGGSAVKSYKATAGGKSCTAGPTARTCTIDGLKNGTRYGVQVRATNRVGTGAASATVNVTPRTVPSAPRTVMVRPGGGYALATWVAPSASGGAAITAYQAAAVDAGLTCSATPPVTTCTVTGLEDGVADTVRVRARNAAGWGPWSVEVAVRPRGDMRLRFAGDSARGQGGTNLTGLDPRTVAAPQSEWASVDTGTDHTCGTLADGTLWCWGGNVHGQLGVGGTTDSESPVQVGTDTDWALVSAGDRTTCAVRTAATLWCWGDGANGRLGQGDTDDRTEPAQVGTDTDWGSVSVGGGQVCGVRTGGTLWCWGLDASGQLGLGDTTDRDVPQQVGESPDWVAVSAGNDHTCGVQAGAALWCWGANAHGALGVGSTDDHPDPQQVGFLTDWATVTAGDGQTCASGADQDLWCWGRGDYGQVGDAARADRTSPVAVGDGIGWTSVAAGDGWTCGVRVGGLNCWGTNVAAGLGGPASDGPAAPETFAPWTLPAPEWTTVSVGGSHACGLADPGLVLCFGSDSAGQLGRPVTASALTRVGGVSSRWSTVSGSDGAACGLRADLTLWCWGETSTGRLPTGGSAPSARPQKMDADGPWSEVSLGATSGCAIGVDGSLWCWGSRHDGQVGDGVKNNAAPVGATRVDEGKVGTTTVAVPTGWARVSVGGSHSCAVRTDGSLWCWGDGFGGALGLGTTTDRTVPTKVGTATWQDVSAGSLVTCATKTDGTLWCWGEATAAAGAGLGLTALTGNVLAPTKVGVAATWRSVSLGTGFGCGTRSDGTLWCWGDGADGRTGLGGTTDHGTPTKVGTGTTWTTVSAGDAHACAMRSDDVALCWGKGDLGQLAQGDGTTQTSPVVAGDSVFGVVAAGATTYVLD
jgi:alpha-tubulin suppressor-like RCC1 family protein